MDWNFNVTEENIHVLASAMAESLYYHAGLNSREPAESWRYSDGYAFRVDYSYRFKTENADHTYCWKCFNERVRDGKDDGNFLPDISCLLKGLDPLDPTQLLREITRIDAAYNWLSYKFIFNKPVQITEELAKAIENGYHQIIICHDAEDELKNVPVVIQTLCLPDDGTSAAIIDKKFLLCNSDRDFKLYTEQEWFDFLQQERNI